jgi:hypothetical protein
VNALNKIGGALLAAILLIAVITGLQTGSGRSALGGVWDAVKTVIAWAGDQISRLGVNVNTAGNLGRSIIIGLVIFTACILLIPAARAGRGLAVSAVLSIVITLLLFQPSLGTSLRNSVSAPAPATVSLR